MRKKTFFLLLLPFFLFLQGLGAQEKKEEKGKFYLGVVRIDKIYKSQLGYKLAYRDGNLHKRFAYIPAKWLLPGKERKASIRYGNSPSYPYMQISYNDGEIDFIKIFMRSGLDNPYWGGYLDLSSKDDDKKEKKEPKPKPTEEEKKEKDRESFKSPPKIFF